MSEQKPGKIFEAIVAIMREVGPIAKDKKNEQRGFNYRSAEAVYNRVQPVLAVHGVFSVPRVQEEQRETGQSKAGGTMHWVFLRVEYTFFAADGSYVVVVVSGEAMDAGDAATAKAMTIAHRIAICQLFNIPFAVIDPESDTPAWAARLQNGIRFQDLNDLKKAWMTARGLQGRTREQLMLDFAEFVGNTTGQKFETGDWRQWKATDLTACYQALQPKEMSDADHQSSSQ